MKEALINKLKSFKFHNATERQIEYYNVLLSKIVKEIKEFDFDFEDDFDILFACIMGIEEPENDCWTQELGYQKLDKDFRDISSAIQKLKSITK